MASYVEQQFIDALKRAVPDRSPEDLELIYAYLHGLEALACLREPALRNICRSVRYELHQANNILYCRGELSTCWYILLSGSVFIDGSMFLPRSSFGKRTAGCSQRPNECLILEPSEMIVIDYPDVQLMKPHGSSLSTTTAVVGASIRHSHQPPSLHHSLDRLLQLDQPPPVPSSGPPSSSASSTTSSCSGSGRQRRDLYLPDGDSELPPELAKVQSVLARSEQYAASRAHPGSSKRASQRSLAAASDTSSAYSGSDMMHSSSVDDPDLGHIVDTMVDTDDEDDDEEEGYHEPRESLIVRDTVRECLEKDPSERTEDDIEILLEFMQHLPAFANMTLATRRALCAVMVFAIVEKADTVVMNDGEELDSWSVILNGHVEVSQPGPPGSGEIQHLHMGDSFGITPTMEKLYHKGVMKTKEDDCQFVCIAQSDYYRILNQGEENTRRHEENGAVVLITEHRVLDGGSRKGYIVIKGSPEKLMGQLVEEHSAVDPTYVEDFLLTYRTFLKSPMAVADNLISWFNVPKLRDKVTRVVLLWVNNHFNDFETDSSMSEFLESFEALLERETMGGQLRLLNIACAAKARPRTVVLTRATRDEVLHFKILGGLERGCAIFISKVERGSKAHEAGLKRGDQILEVNNHNFEHIAHNRALEILRGTTHLSITVKSNLLAFKEMLVTPDNSPSARRLRKDGQLPGFDSRPSQQRLSVPDLDEPGAGPVIPPVINSPSKAASHGGDKHKDKRDGFMSQGHRTKIRKALAKFSFLPRNVNSDPNLNQLDDSAVNYSRGGGPRKGSSSSNNSSPLHTPHLSQSASNPDLSSLGGGGLDEGLRHHDYPEHVIKVYRHDQTCKYLLVHRETTAREVVMLSLKEFGVSEPSSHFCLCEVSVEGENFVKQKRLPDQMAGLPERININARYYLKANSSTEPLVPDELTGELVKECHTSFLHLNPTELAAQLTLRDFQLYHDIEPTEYVDDLFDLDSRFGTPHLGAFSQLVNLEMFWVISEVCGEANLVKRMKIIKHFIKIARHCKDCKNFNSMFAIISGLGHASVSRLRETWQRVPNKYLKLFEDLQDLMDPSRNMSKYRNLVNSEMVQPPLIPFFPVVKKDLTFIHLGNDSKVDGLINFEKLRMIAKEVRHVGNMASAQYDLSSMFLRDSQTVFSAFAGSMNASAVATLRRKRRNSTVPNPKKMFEEAQMTRRVRAYLQNMEVIEDESRLSELSLQCEPPASATSTSSGGSGRNKRDASPLPPTGPVGPKFGAESPQAVRKLMSLSEKVRPHNNKANPLPPHHSLLPSRSPHVGRRPHSPRQPPPPRQTKPVNLSPESSSVVSLSNMPLKKSATSGSVGSAESTSPTNSVGSGGGGSRYETDSGHNSIASSNFDSHSSSSVGSASSPPAQRRHLSAGSAAPGCYYPSSLGPLPSAPSSAPVVPGRSRPPLPPYHEVVLSNPAYNAYLSGQYRGGGGGRAGQRPPLPDYHSAMHQRQQQQRKYPPASSAAPAAGPAYHARSHSYEGVVSGFYQEELEEECHEVLVDGPQIRVEDEDVEEQVSAV